MTVGGYIFKKSLPVKIKNKGTLTLALTDVFNSRRYRYLSRGINFFTEGDYRWHNRQLRLTLNYRLNQDKKRGGGYGGGESF